MQTPEPFPPPEEILPPRRQRQGDPPRPAVGVWIFAHRLTWVSGLVLALSSFMDWYAGSGPEGADRITIGVIGWHTGPLGKLVFFIGLGVLALVALGEAGIELPPAVPESLVVITLGSLATIFVLIRMISIPGKFLPADGWGVGIWISLFSALAVILAGILRASEEI